MVALVHEAIIVALKQRKDQKNSDVNVVTMEHFEKAILTVIPSVSAEDRERYAKMKNMYTKKVLPSVSAETVKSDIVE